ncbi:MAG: hypothetical protein AB8B57_11995 [Congregibacter sp.]
MKRPLEELRPFLIAANVRGTIDPMRMVVGDGIGKVGDLILGTVLPEDGQAICVLDQQRHAHEVTGPVKVLAVLGPRDSSTHVCATVPSDGLPVASGTRLHWVAGESGIVGQLERDAPHATVHRPESALPFLCEGLLLGLYNAPINIRAFGIEQIETRLTKPVIFVGATSTEAGKTVLCGEIIRQLTEAGVRVAATKVTGTGGVRDSMYHLECGAAAVLDSVDAGLISTHCNPDDFRAQIPHLFRSLSDRAVDVIVAELGGDLLSANNPVLLKLDEVVDNTQMLVVISNDALGAAGVNAMNEAQFRFPASKIRHFTSPFRNHAGMRRRMALAGVMECYDPRSPTDLQLIVEQIRHLAYRGGTRAEL